MNSNRNHKCIILLVDENPHASKYKEFHQVYQAPKTKSTKDERKSQFGKKTVDPREKAFAELMKIEVKLSEKIFWWESPNICRWEPWEESDDFAKLDQETQDYNLHYDDYENRQGRKLFAAPNPCQYKKQIELKDFNLASAPDEIKLSVLMKNYLVPMMPEEYKCFSEQLAIYEKKRKEWKEILEVKKKVEAAGNQSSTINLKDFIKDAPENIDVRNITYEDFKKFFDHKSMQSNFLFPVECRKLIEVLENPEIVESTSTSPGYPKTQRKESSEILDFQETKPRKNEPIMLSELLQQIENVKKSLRPFFREIGMIETRVSIITNESEQKSDQLRSRLKSKSHVHRPSSVTQRSSRASSKPRTSRNNLGRKTLRNSSTPKRNESSTVIEKVPLKVPSKLIPHHRGKWSIRDIYEQSYDSAKKTVTFYTGKLGTFGFATRKYSNLPLKSWEIFPDLNGTEKFVLLKIETQFTDVVFKITNDGYTFKITTGKKSPPQEIEKPVKVFELKKILTALNFNLFPEVDASCYVTNNCEKHKVMEFHTYKSMAVYCLSHHFKSTKWNRWAHRRVAIFDSRMIIKDAFKCLMVTPLSTSSVIVREKSTDLEVVELDYEMNPPEQEVTFLHNI